MPFLHHVALALLLPLFGAAQPATASGRFSDLATHLLNTPYAVSRDGYGRPTAVFGLPFGEARVLLLAVSRDRAAPPGYRPPDLVWTLGRPTRAIIVDDFQAMTRAAALDGVELIVVSGYRSPAEQVDAFEGAVGRQLARAEGTIDRAEAEARATRVVAAPGHSQHQLGTALDVSSWEVNYGLPPRFADTLAGRWVAEYGWAYGFILPYTAQGEARTGYSYEPWHIRWIGRPLAEQLWADGYLDHPELIPDDYLRAVEEILDAESAPW